MKKLLFPVLLFFALKSSGQTPIAYFIDGYHGGIYGHLPPWQTKFMVDKLAQYPDWKINLELEPESWDTIRVNDPASYAAFQKLFADQSSKGRIEYVNPNYGQSYLYNISGESVIRQFYYGMKKLREHFPTAQFRTYSSEEPCFTSALPQILRSYGFTYASLKNPNTCWGGYTRAYGGELVNWIGPDGSSILTSPRYEVEALKPRSIWETIASSNSREYIRKSFADGIRHPIGMCLQDAGWAFGPWLKGANVVGSDSHPTGNAAPSGNDYPDDNSVYTPTVYQTWKGYFANISNGKADRDWKFSQEDVLVGLMWGSQVLQRIAREVRTSENAILQAEKLAALAAAWQGTAWPETNFDAAWRTLLLSQHHDCWIVPYNGKKGDTWADKVVSWTGFTNEQSDSIAQAAMRQLSGDKGQYVRVFNTTAAPRTEWVRFGDRLFQANVPPMGYASYRLDALPAANATSASTASVIKLADGQYEIQTDLYKILIDPAKGGAITSWVATQLGNKEFVEQGRRFNELRGNFYNAGGMKSGSDTSAQIEILENTPSEIKLAIKGFVAGNPFTQTLTVQQGQPRMDIHLKIDWQGNPAIGEYFDVPKNEEVRKAYYDDRFKLLALFPLNLPSQKVYKNAPFDVTASRLANTFYNRWDSIKNNVLLNWVDVEDGAGDYGMALFCDHTTSYAHGEDFPLGLTVQYSGNGIFYRDYKIDRPTEMNYALIPHAGKWDKAGIWSEGTKWNEPLIATAANGGGRRSLLQTEKGVEVSSLTLSGKALVARFFNAEATAPLVRIYLGFAAASAAAVELDGQSKKSLPIHADKTGRRWVELPIPRFGIRTIKFEQTQPLTPFQTGERVSFVGNSITEAGYYESYVWLYYMLHFPDRRISIYNCGIGGDRAKNILARLDADVLEKKPTTICVTFGMNDSGYFEFLWANADSAAKARVSECRSYFDTIALKLKAYAPAKKIMITSSLYDETVKNPKNYFPKKSQAMSEIAAFQAKAAVDNHWGFVDFLHPMTDITLQAQRSDSTFTLTGSDRIHPGNAGHFVMAWLFLKQQGLAGKPVADIVIDAAGKKVQRAENCRLSALSVAPGDIRVDYLAASLPFPQDSIPRLWENTHRQTQALDVIPFNDEMNREMLTVHGLGNGNYSVAIDDERVGQWTEAQLSAGINLALLKNTPEYEQAMSILWLNEERMALESKLRAYYWLQYNFFKDEGLYFADNARAMDSLNAVAPKNWFVASKKDNYRAARYAAVRQGWQKEMDVLIDEIYKVNQPRKHTIRIKKVD